MSFTELPKHWKWMKLGAVGKLLSGQHILERDYNFDGSGIAYFTGPADFGDYYPEISKWTTKPKTIATENSVLITVKGAGVGKINILNIKEAAISRQLMAYTSDLLSYKFSFFYLSSKFHDFQRLALGSTVPGIGRETLLNYSIPLPPLAEQQRIVIKLEELFSELDAGLASLNTAAKQLKTYRQAVLKWAFEGKLTNDHVTEGALPAGWKWARLGEVVGQPKYGTSKKCDYKFQGKAVLRIPNISHGVVDNLDLKFAEFDQSEVETYSLQEGDLLTIRSNGSVDLVGKCALITKRDEAYLYAGYLIRLRPLKEIINPKFLLNVLSSSTLRNQIESKAKSTSGVNNINSDELKSLMFRFARSKNSTASSRKSKAV